MQNKAITFSAACLGLDNAGKTTLMRNLSNSTRFEIFPTSTLEIHYVNINQLGKPCLIYDLSGNGRHRSSWRLVYDDINAIIYVIDVSHSEKRFELQKRLIEEVIADEVVKKKQLPILFMLNKKDKQNTYDKDWIIKQLGLDQLKIKNRILYKETSGFSGVGLKDAIENLADVILKS